MSEIESCAQKVLALLRSPYSAVDLRGSEGRVDLDWMSTEEGSDELELYGEVSGFQSLVRGIRSSVRAGKFLPGEVQ